MKYLMAVILFLSSILGPGAANAEDFPLLTDAIVSSSDEYAIDALIKKSNQDVNVTDEEGCSALMLAAMRNPNPVIIHVLIKNGARINERHEVSGKTPLFFAAEFNPVPEVLLALLNEGADPKIIDIFSRTASYYLDRNPKQPFNAEAERRLGLYSAEETSSDSETSR